MQVKIQKQMPLPLPEEQQKAVALLIKQAACQLPLVVLRG